MAEELLEAHEAVVVSDTANDQSLSEPVRQAWLSLDVVAVIATSLIKGGKAVAAFGLHSAVPRQWTGSDVQLVRDVADRTWAVVERARAEEKLAASEEKYRTLFDSIDEGVTTLEAIFDDQGKPLNYRYLDNNPAVKKIFGFEWPIGNTVLDILPDVEYHWIETICGVACTGDPYALNIPSRAWTDGSVPTSPVSVTRATARSSPFMKTSPSASGPRRRCAKARSGRASY